MENKNRIILAGALIGAITGVVGAMMLVRRAEETDGRAEITTGDGMKLGVLLIGLLRAIASLGDDK
jgi:hypothetical protein